ncbi:MAG TPA: hypothetical protein VKB87_27180, partial [Myxococcaceae bacterium]|nr:hypothetical protein [Myxococcaceae bacterium]
LLISISAVSLVGISCADAGRAGTAGRTGQKPQVARYSVTDLGTLGGTASIAFGINNAGRVGGGANMRGENQHPFLWDKGQMIDLGTLGGLNANAGGTNQNDELAVLSETATKDPLGEDFCGFGTNLICLGAIWKHGALTPLPTLGGNNGQAVTINNRGQLVGFAENSTRDTSCMVPQVLGFEAVVWGSDGHVQELSPLPGDSVGFALGINDSGQVVGSSGSCANTRLVPLRIGPHAVLWENGSATDLGSLGGKRFNTAAAINNRGEVVGASTLPDEATLHSFLWTKATGMRDLGTVGADFSSLPTAISNKGQVVGASCVTADFINGPCRAYLWQDNAMTDLNDLIPVDSPLELLFAYGINDAGQIVGQAMHKDTSDLRAFLATPIKSNVGSESVPDIAPDGSKEPARTLPTP